MLSYQNGELVIDVEAYKKVLEENTMKNHMLLKIDRPYIETLIKKNKQYRPERVLFELKLMLWRSDSYEEFENNIYKNLEKGIYNIDQIKKDCPLS